MHSEQGGFSVFSGVSIFLTKDSTNKPIPSPLLLLTDDKSSYIILSMFFSLF